MSPKVQVECKFGQGTRMSGKSDINISAAFFLVADMDKSIVNALEKTVMALVVRGQ